jgi:hypothetical protein
VATIGFAAQVAILRESDSRVPQSQKLRSKARIEDPTEPESSQLGQYKLREDDLIKPTKPGSLPCGPVHARQSYQKARERQRIKMQPLSEYVWKLLLTNSSLARIREEKREQRHKNCEVGSEVSWEAPVLAGVTETAAGDVESANFCRDRREREDDDRRTQNRQRTTI